jgi:hypothetical protein
MLLTCPLVSSKNMIFNIILGQNMQNRTFFS